MIEKSVKTLYSTGESSISPWKTIFSDKQLHLWAWRLVNFEEGLIFALKFMYLDV